MKQFPWIVALGFLMINTLRAEEVVIDFDDLPAVQFMVTLEDGTVISATPEGGFLIRTLDGTETIVPKELVPDGVLPGRGEVPIAAELPADVSPHATFSTSVDAGLYYFSGAEAVGTSPLNNITAAVDPNAFPYSAPLLIEFTTPVNNFSFTVSSDNDTGKIAEIRIDYDGDQVSQVDVLGNGDFSDAILMDLSIYPNVTSVEVVNITDTFGLSYDDFRFSTVSAIPEPASSVLAIGAAISLALRRRSSGQ